MKLIVGLGNPGIQYERTRHNAGFMVIDRLARKHASGAIPKARFNGVCLETEIAGEKCLLIKPTTYMNLSGRAVAEPIRFYKLEPISDLLVLVDDVALAVGAIRLRNDGSAGGHNGLADIERSLGTSAYPRCRIGIGTKPAYMVQSDWVLSRFGADEEPDLERAIDQATSATEHFVAKGIEAAMNQFNGKASEQRPKPARPSTDSSPHTTKPNTSTKPNPQHSPGSGTGSGPVSASETGPTGERE